MKILYRVNKTIIFDSYVINIYDNDYKLGFINVLNRIVLNIDKDGNAYLGNKIGYKECQNTTEKIKNEIKEHVTNYKNNYKRN